MEPSNVKHTLNWFVKTKDSDKANRHKNTDRADFQEALKICSADNLINWEPVLKEARNPFRYFLITLYYSHF